MSSVNPARPDAWGGKQCASKMCALSGADVSDSLPEDLVKLQEAARVGDVHPATVRRWIARSMLTAYRRRPSGPLYVSAAEVANLVRPVESGGAA